MPTIKKVHRRKHEKSELVFPFLHLCDVIPFRDDHARMRIRGPLAPPACLKF